MRTFAISAMLFSGGLLLASCAGTESPETYQYNDSYRASDANERARYDRGQFRYNRYHYDSPDRFGRYRSYDDN